jgi:hypothetical protein
MKKSLDGRHGISKGKHSLCERGGPARPRFTRTLS